MDRCPTEIWNHIFSEACIDNGITGRSLSLVSKYIHETSKSVTLQSLSVHGPKQIHGLAGLLADTLRKDRKVRYLFISTTNMHRRSYSPDHEEAWDYMDEVEDSNSADVGDDLEIYRDLQTISPSIPSESSNPSTRFASTECEYPLGVESTWDAILHIVRTVAPTVRVLHVFFTFERPSVFLPISVPFPALAELTLYGPYANEPSMLIASAETVPEPRTSNSIPPIPSLRRLHLANFFRLPTDYFGLIASVAPSLTHLCLPYQFSLGYYLGLGFGNREPASSSSMPYMTVGILPSTKGF